MIQLNHADNNIMMRANSLRAYSLPVTVTYLPTTVCVVLILQMIIFLQ